MCLLALGTLWAEPKQVVDADLQIIVVTSLMVIVALDLTYFAKAPLIERTRLLLLGSASSIRGRMSVHTSLALLIAMSVLLVVLADRDLLFDIRMQVRAVLSNSTIIPQPICTHFLFPSISVWCRME